MATATPYWQLEKEYYSLTDAADVVLRVVEHTAVTRTENGFPLTVKAPSKVHEFRVNRATLSAGSTFFNQLLNRISGPDAEQGVPDVHEDDGTPSVRALNIWFKIFHGCVTSDTHELSIDGVWSMISVAAKYGIVINAEPATAWFDAWYNIQPNIKKFGYRDYTSVLYPAYLFNHAKSFTQATKYLVYHNSQSSITECQPMQFSRNPPMNALSLHMPHHVMHQLNAAKGRLKTMLHRALYTPIDKLLKNANCSCAANVLYAYERSLACTGVWPLESKWQASSISSAVFELNLYDGARWKVETCGSDACTFPFDEVVKTAQTEIRNYFDGLCLDCISTSDSKADMHKHDELYWNHALPGFDWDHKCRQKHGQPSWYFSFMGRREKMQEWAKAPKVKKEGRPRAEPADVAAHSQNCQQQQIDGKPPSPTEAVNTENAAQPQYQHRGDHLDDMRTSYGPSYSRLGNYRGQQQYGDRRYQNGGQDGNRGPRGGFQRSSRDDFFAPNRYGNRRGNMNNGHGNGGGSTQNGSRFTAGPSDASYTEPNSTQGGADATKESKAESEARADNKKPDSANSNAKPSPADVVVANGEKKSTSPVQKDSPKQTDSDGPENKTSIPEIHVEVADLSMKDDGGKKAEAEKTAPAMEEKT